MGALSGKVVIVIIACISVVLIANIVVSIVVISSGVETTKNSTKIPTAIYTTQTTNGGGTILAEFRCFSEGILL